MLNNTFFPPSPIGQRDKKGSEKSFLSLSTLLKDRLLAFLDNNLSTVFVKNNVIPFFGIEEIRNIFDKSHIPFPSYFTTPQKFHTINNINHINEMNKYLVNDVNNINNRIEIIDKRSGVVWRERNC